MVLLGRRLRPPDQRPVPGGAPTSVHGASSPQKLTVRTAEKGRARKLLPARDPDLRRDSLSPDYGRGQLEVRTPDAGRGILAAADQQP